MPVFSISPCLLRVRMDLSIRAAMTLSAASARLDGMKIVLVPGFPDFTGLEFFPDQYFRGVREMLQARGFEAVTAQVKPFDSLHNRATQIKEFFENEPILQDPRKAHIIAHSAGGVDSRFLVSPNGLGLANRVRSITTISTPHRGTPIADLAKGTLTVSGNILGALKAKFPHLEQGVQELTEDEMTQFNHEHPPVSGIGYFSYAGVLGAERILQGALLAVTQPLFFLDGANDGWVSVRSGHFVSSKVLSRPTTPSSSATTCQRKVFCLSVF
jgi:triacylglycerol lipase